MLGVAKRWHLEREEVKVVRAFSFHMGRFAVLVALDDETVGEEFSVEAADDHKLVLSELSHASSLPGGHIGEDLCRVWSNVKHLPSVRLATFKSQPLDRVAILLV